MLVVSDTCRVAPHPPVPESGRPAAEHRVVKALLLVFRRFFPQVVEHAPLVDIRYHGPDRPARIQRVERPHQREQARFAVGVVGKQCPEGNPAVAELLVLELDRLRDTIDVVGPRKPNQLTAAEQVQLFDIDYRLVLSALAADGKSRVQRPDILGRNEQVDLAVPSIERFHGGVIEIDVAAQDAFRFVGKSCRVRIAGLEQELRRDNPVPGNDVPPVGEPEEPVVFLWVAEVEDILLVENDFADHDPVCFELCLIQRLALNVCPDGRRRQQQAGQQGYAHNADAESVHVQTLLSPS